MKEGSTAATDLCISSLLLHLKEERTILSTNAHQRLLNSESPGCGARENIGLLGKLVWRSIRLALGERTPGSGTLSPPRKNNSLLPYVNMLLKCAIRKGRIDSKRCNVGVSSYEKTPAVYKSLLQIRVGMSDET